MDYSLLVGIHYVQSVTSDESESSEDDDDDKGPPLNRSMGTLPPLVSDKEIPPPAQVYNNRFSFH